MKVKILQKRIPKRLDSIFYDGEIAEVKYKGHIFSAVACGEIDCDNDESHESIRDAYGMVEDTDLNDKDIEKIWEGESDWKFINNNWWTILIDGEDYHEEPFDGDYDSIIVNLTDKSLLDELIEIHEDRN